MNTCQINKFIKNYKDIENDILEVVKKSNELLNEEQKIKTVNKTLENINYIISIYEGHKMDYTLY